jgi:hypothetical protein
MGIEGSSPKLLLIQVHGVLRRLLESGEVEQIHRDGKTLYRALTPAEKFARLLRNSPMGMIFSGLSNPPSAPKQNGTMNKEESDSQE